MTTLTGRFVLISPMTDKYRNTGSVTISIWKGSKSYATIYNSGGDGEFEESIESARSRYSCLIKKGYKLNTSTK